MQSGGARKTPRRFFMLPFSQSERARGKIHQHIKFQKNHFRACFYSVKFGFSLLYIGFDCLNGAGRGAMLLLQFSCD